MTYINITIKLQKLYSPPRNIRARNKSPALLLKKPLCTGDLSPLGKIFIERPVIAISIFSNNEWQITNAYQEPCQISKIECLTKKVNRS